MQLDCLELISLNTSFEGNISLFDWTQTTDSDPNEPDGPNIIIDESNNRITFIVRGEMLIGLSIFDLPSLRARRLLTIEIVYNYSTGELIPGMSYWYYTTN